MTNKETGETKTADADNCGQELVHFPHLLIVLPKDNANWERRPTTSNPQHLALARTA